MKNLENLKLKEINIKELKIINGGNWWDDIVDTVNDTINTAREAVAEFVETFYLEDTPPSGSN